MSLSRTSISQNRARRGLRGLLAVLTVLFCVSNLQTIILPPIDPPIFPPIDPPDLDLPTVINFDSSVPERSTPGSMRVSASSSRGTPLPRPASSATTR